MKKVVLTKSAQKVLQKAPKDIKEKFLELVPFLCAGDYKSCRFKIKKLKGKFKTYHQAHLSRDFRVWFREEDTRIVIVIDAGTHNRLGTG